jgi:hypothetical protein
MGGEISEKQNMQMRIENLQKMMDEIPMQSSQREIIDRDILCFSLYLEIPEKKIFAHDISLEKIKSHFSEMPMFKDLPNVVPKEVISFELPKRKEVAQHEFDKIHYFAKEILLTKRQEKDLKDLLEEIEEMLKS